MSNQMKQDVLQPKGKLTFYNKIKIVYEKEKYLKIKNYENRQAISKLRLSAHPLLIETGRIMGLDRNDRICKFCNQQKLEDEKHLIFECSKYNMLRETTFRKIKAIANIDLNETPLCSLQNLFNSLNIESLQLFGEFIKKAFSSRKSEEEEHTSYLIILPTK